MTTYISIIVAILAFSLIVVAHEAGHLLAAKKNGIFVLEFAVGMGPKLLGAKLGETEYTIRLFPIGGFCKMLGEDEESADPRAFGNKGPMARFIVIVAGALMNFLLGAVLIFVLVSMVGYTTNEVSRVGIEQPAYQAGIREGDRIIAINGRKTYIFEDILFAMNFAGRETVQVQTLSNGETKYYDIMPEILTSTVGGKTYSRYIIGVSPKAYAGMFSEGSSQMAPGSFTGYIQSTYHQFRFYVNATFESLYMLITGKVSMSELSGIVGIGGAVVDSIEEPINATYETGEEIPISLRLGAAVENVLTIMILITINLGIMNLLPFPALDGGRAVFILLEGIRRKPIDQDKEGLIHFAGFVLLMLLMVFVTYNDIAKLFTDG